jgi:hypothetical protein
MKLLIGHSSLTACFIGADSLSSTVHSRTNCSALEWETVSPFLSEDLIFSVAF